jgi:hypothetical protein
MSQDRAELSIVAKLRGDLHRAPAQTDLAGFNLCIAHKLRAHGDSSLKSIRVLDDWPAGTIAARLPGSWIN